MSASEQPLDSAARYELRELVGKGSFGSVHRGCAPGWDLAVGRERSGGRWRGLGPA